MSSRRSTKASPTSPMKHSPNRTRSTSIRRSQPIDIPGAREVSISPEFTFWRPNVIQGLSPVSGHEDDDPPFSQLCLAERTTRHRAPSKSGLSETSYSAVKAHAPGRLRHRSSIRRKSLEAEPAEGERRVRMLVRYSSLQRFLSEGMTRWRGRDIVDLLDELEDEFSSMK